MTICQKSFRVFPYVGDGRVLYLNVRRFIAHEFEQIPFAFINKPLSRKRPYRANFKTLFDKRWANAIPLRILTMFSS